MNAVTRTLGPGNVPSVAIPTAVGLGAATTTARATDHQKPPAMTKVSATAKVWSSARQRQVTTAITAHTMAAARLVKPTRSRVKIRHVRSDRRREVGAAEMRTASSDERVNWHRSAS